MEQLIGVDVGGTLIRAARFDDDLSMLDRAEQPTRADEGADAVFDRLVETIEAVYPEAPKSLQGIGVALPGPLDIANGVLIAPPNLPLRNVPIVEMLNQRLGKNVYIGNDADLAGLAEFMLGAGHDADTMVYMTISTGIGGGIIQHGEIVTGRGQGGEIGHMVILPDGPLCNCGKPGHLEGLASGTAIAKLMRERLNAGDESLVRELVNGDIAKVTAVEVGKAAQAGDALALELITQAGRYIGMSIASLMVLINPDMFVLGGGVTSLGPLLFDPIHEAVETYTMHPRYYEDVPIVQAALGGDVGLYGGAALVKLRGH